MLFSLAHGTKESFRAALARKGRDIANVIEVMTRNNF